MLSSIASAGVVAASTPALTMEDAPPEYSEVVNQPQDMVPFQQGMGPVQYVQQPGQQGMVPVQYVQQPGQQGMGPVQQTLGRPVHQAGQQQQGLQQPVFMYVAQQPPGPGGGTLQPPTQQVPYMVSRHQSRMPSKVLTSCI